MNKILKTTKFVFENSDLVKIDRDKVREFSKKFNHNDVQHWLDEAPFDFSHFTDKDKLHFIFLLNALSFSYWGEPKWTVEYKDKKHDGAWGMILALGRAIDEGHKLLDFEYCSQVSKKDFANILRGNVEIPLLEKRWEILRELGTNMTKKYGGQASKFIEKAGGDAQKLVELIMDEFPSFADKSIYKRKEIYFYKRAQLLVADIYQIFRGQNYGNLENINQITACADYKLPQILRKIGVMKYEDSLAKMIDEKMEIPHGSPEEVEIRANTIWAVELIKEEVKKRNPNIVSFEVNDHLWLATQEKFDGDKSYHLTRTTAY